MKRVRCAIYTRKSSEEGLEQAFNSLDAQRDACAAYVLSQASEGWSALPTVYDDGGLSGGTLQRPALQRLLTDVEHGLVDIIVVYKVDRLTRSLFDFAKLVERFDAAGVSFVSVTQSFNTTTSMGRLTLNMLLSFAQFEREVTAERIRDKLAASKAKGMWMGGVPPLGYRPDGRTLAIVDEHAALVRHLFERYLALGSVRLLEEELAARRIKAPPRATSTGKPIGGVPFSRGQLRAILSRRIYLGEIPHKDRHYPGQHQPIVDRELFDRVQQRLADNRQGERGSGRPPRAHLLAGKLFDNAGEPLVATHATKGSARYRYYVSEALHAAKAGEGLRIPAREIERLVAERIAVAFDNPLELVGTAALPCPPARLAGMFEQARLTAAALRSTPTQTFGELVRAAAVHASHVEITCSLAAIAAVLKIETPEQADTTLTLTSHVELKRSGLAVRLVQPNGALVAAEANSSLIRLLVRARGWWDELRLGVIDATRLAKREGVTRSYLLRVVRLAFLSPMLTNQILHGRQPAHITSAMLTAPDGVSPDWRIQGAAPTMTFPHG